MCERIETKQVQTHIHTCTHTHTHTHTHRYVTNVFFLETIGLELLLLTVIFI